jgi:hypothetical protein
MDNIGTFLLCTGLMIFVFLLPMWAALAVRILFRRANKRILAMLTALPFAVFLLTRPDKDFLPTLEGNEYGPAFSITMAIIFGTLTLLVNYGIPYLLAEEGIAIGDKIMKKSNRSPPKPSF